MSIHQAANMILIRCALITNIDACRFSRLDIDLEFLFRVLLPLRENKQIVNRMTSAAMCIYECLLKKNSPLNLHAEICIKQSSIKVLDRFTPCRREFVMIYQAVFESLRFLAVRRVCKTR